MTGRLGQLLAVAAVVSLAMTVAACTSAGSATASSYHGPALPTAPARAAVTLKESGSALLLPLFASWAVTTGNLAAYLGTAAMQALPGQVVALSSAQIAKIG